MFIQGLTLLNPSLTRQTRTLQIYRYLLFKMFKRGTENVTQLAGKLPMIGVTPYFRHYFINSRLLKKWYQNAQVSFIPAELYLFLLERQKHHYVGLKGFCYCIFAKQKMNVELEYIANFKSAFIKIYIPTKGWRKNTRQLI